MLCPARCAACKCDQVHTQWRHVSRVPPTEDRCQCASLALIMNIFSRLQTLQWPGCLRPTSFSESVRVCVRRCLRAGWPSMTQLRRVQRKMATTASPPQRPPLLAPLALRIPPARNACSTVPPSMGGHPPRKSIPAHPSPRNAQGHNRRIVKDARVCSQVGSNARGRLGTKLPKLGANRNYFDEGATSSHQQHDVNTLGDGCPEFCGPLGTKQNHVLAAPKTLPNSPPSM